MASVEDLLIGLYNRKGRAEEFITKSRKGITEYKSPRQLIQKIYSILGKVLEYMKKMEKGTRTKIPFYLP